MPVLDNSEHHFDRGDFFYRLNIGDVCDPLIELFYQHKHGILLFHYHCEADEMWSFVGKKSNKQWIWLAMNTSNRQIIGLHIGGRSAKDAQKLWDSVPKTFKQQATFFTDYWEAYSLVIPTKQHIALGKDSGFTNHQERFNLTLRQRVSRLVRKNLAFSKKQGNHVGAIKYFVSNYNLKIAQSLKNRD